jgi:1-acyl-sn-glycerol-3-phosphate acyltransferase
MLAFTRLLLFLALTLILLPAQIGVQHFAKGRYKNAIYWIPNLYHRSCCRLFGIKLVVRGRRRGRLHSKTVAHPETPQPRLIVCNHMSYLDITVLGSVLPASFIAKSEIAGWPLFGLLAKLQNTLFVRRTATQTGNQLQDLTNRLSQGDTMILFPEGTSGDGSRLLPFKSSLFGIINQFTEQPLIIQPVVINYVACNGLPVSRNDLPNLAWYGDMSIAGHGWKMLGLGRIHVLVDFLPPLAVTSRDNRKTIAQQCFQQMNEAYENNSRAWSVVDGIPRRPKKPRHGLFPKTAPQEPSPPISS